jgi:multidrug resistance protein
MEPRTSDVDDKKESSRAASPNASAPNRIEKAQENGVLLNQGEALAQASNLSGTPMYVTFASDDPTNPRNFPRWKKWYITCFICLLNVLTCLCAGGYSSGSEGIQEAFGVSAEIGTLGLSLYILGFALGPLVLAPLSEYYGRSPVYIGSWFILFISQLPVALAPNIGTVLACRFIAGFGGSAPLTNTGGTISDLWERNDSGNAMRSYGISSTFGPPIALVISGYIAQNLGWRWLFWVFMIITGVAWVILVLTLPETRHSIILEKKAKQVRKALVKQGVADVAVLDSISDAHNKGEKRSIHRLFAINLSRPIRFLFTEPITMGAAAYNGFIYGIVYLFNEAFPLVFGNNHGFNTGEQGLAFLGFAIGVLVAALFHPLQEKYYLRRVAENNGKGVPEARMLQAMFGAFFLPVSLFW